jgi:hypothetical protein
MAKERYEAHIFQWWMHNHLGDEVQPPSPIPSQFDQNCERYGITPKRGKQIVKYYLKRYSLKYRAVFDMGRQPEIPLLDLHFAYKDAGKFRDRVLQAMAELHNANLFRTLAQHRKATRRTIADLVRR